jgi:hypothetical protein
VYATLPPFYIGGVNSPLDLDEDFESSIICLLLYGQVDTQLMELKTTVEPLITDTLINEHIQ